MRAATCRSRPARSPDRSPRYRALFLAALGVIAVYFGLSTFAGKSSTKSCVAMTISVATMALFTLIAYPSMQQQAQGSSLSPGLGLILYGSGTASIAVAVVRAWISRRTDRSAV